MSGKIRRIDFSPSEWLEGTTELDLAERGLYITACALIYARGGPIHPDLLRSAARCHLRLFNRCLSRLIETGKLDLNEGQLSNKRCLSELQNASNRSLIGAQNVSKRWAKNKNNNDLADTAELPDGNANHQPSTINHQPSESSDSSLRSESGAGAPPRPEFVVVGGTEAPKPPDLPPDPKRALYEYGKAVLGKTAGGMVTNLLAACDGDVDRALYNLRLAERAADPRQYVGAILRGEKYAWTDWDAVYARMGVRPDGTQFGDDLWVSPFDRPGDDGTGQAASA